MSDLQWPPRDRAEMQAWQDKHGNDQDIANAVGGLRRNDVRYRRLVFDVSAVPLESPSRFNGLALPKDKKAAPVLSEDQITEIYDDRTYDDVGAA
jgi:hypothetical protein